MAAGRGFHKELVEEWENLGEMINWRVGKTFFTTCKVNCDIVQIQLVDSEPSMVCCYFGNTEKWQGCCDCTR